MLLVLVVVLQVISSQIHIILFVSGCLIMIKGLALCVCSGCFALISRLKCWSECSVNTTIQQDNTKTDVFITINLKKKPHIRQYQNASSRFQPSHKVGGRQSFISTAGFSHCCHEYLNKNTAVSSFLPLCTARGYSLSCAGALQILSIISGPLAELAT